MTKAFFYAILLPVVRFRTKIQSKNTHEGQGPSSPNAAINVAEEWASGPFHIPDLIMNLSRRTLPCVFLVAVLLVLGAGRADAKISGSTTPTVKMFSGSGTLLGTFSAFSKKELNGVRVSSADTNGDGNQEIVVGTGTGTSSEVRVFTVAGHELARFSPYGKGFRGGINVAAYDLDGDGRSEIITVPGLGGGPEIKIFSGQGILQSHFFAFDKKFRGGASVAAGAFGKNDSPLIAVGSGYGSGHVRFFKSSGAPSGPSFFPFGKITAGVTVGVLPMAGQRSRLLVTPGRSMTAQVRIYDVTKISAPISEFLAMPSSFLGGVQLTGADLASDGSSEVIIGTGAGSQPRIKIYSTSGKEIENTVVYDSAFRGGVNVAAINGTVVVGPGAIGTDGRADLHKYIEIDLSDQTLRYYQDGGLLGVRKVSTGKWSTPTPIGTFAIKNKIPLAYSKPFDLYMEWWMAFSADGSYGLHALPFWQLKNGGRKYEGVGHLGTPVSHGCIRQSLAEAKTLFRWAEVGTAVFVQR